MNRNGLLAVTMLSTSLIGCNAAKKSEKPNVVLIFVDDLGWKDVGFMGSKFYETPNIDRLANNGMIFTQAYAGAANCAPSRACLMSGQWTPRHGIYTVESSERGKSRDRKLIPTPNNTTLPESYFLIPEALKKSGYVTCHSGKWHLNDDPKTQGFDVNIGGCHAGNPGSYYPPYTKVPLQPRDSGQYLTDLIMDMTIEFIEKSDDTPFFLYYSPYAVHTPIQPVDSLLEKYRNKPTDNGQDNAEYATMVENLDRNIGRLIESLDKKGKLDNTIIIFTSDNGGLIGVTNQKPLRAGKGSYYEGGIREPMFVYWKSKVAAASVCDVPVYNLDIFPTLAEIVGCESDQTEKLDGNSLLPLLTQTGSMPDRALYWHFPIYLEGGNKETQDKKFRTRPGSAIRYGDWKLIHYFENDEYELYNLKEDIGEKNNLITMETVFASKLQVMLKDWITATNAPVPVSPNPEYIGE